MKTALRLLFVFVLTSHCAATAVARTNFIIILCDDLGYGDLGCFASPSIKTPNLDRLAAEGMKLTHCYASFPVCSPSRAGLLTGRNANRLGIHDWIPPQTASTCGPVKSPSPSCSGAPATAPATRASGI